MEILVGNDKLKEIRIGNRFVAEVNGWRMCTGSSPFLPEYTMLYRVHEAEKFMDVSISGTVGSVNASDKGTLLIDLSTLVNKITSADIIMAAGNRDSVAYVLSIDGAKLFMNNALNSIFWQGNSASSHGEPGKQFARFYYDELL